MHWRSVDTQYKGMYLVCTLSELMSYTHTRWPGWSTRPRRPGWGPLL